MARIWVDGKPKDRSTGIDITGEEFDFKARRFKMRSSRSISHNSTLADLEQDIYKTILSGGAIRKEKATRGDQGDLTLSRLLDMYEQRLDSNQILNRKTGRQLAQDTRDLLKFDIKYLRRYLKNGIDFNFSENNITNPKSPQNFSDFTTSLKAYLSGLENNTIEAYLNRYKKIIRHICKLKGIELGSLLDDMKVNHIEKDVVILDQDQVDFVINNYQMMVKDCQTPLERKVMQYWRAGIILNARRKDMTLWNESNLYFKDNATWIKYIPHKSKGSSGKWVDVPVYDPRLVEIFRENIRKYKGKLLPPCKSFNPSQVMKRIARRYEIFRREIHIEKGGEIQKVMMCDYIKLHQMRASGASDKIMKGVPENVVKSFTGHTVDSKSWARYIKVLNSAKQEYANVLASYISDPHQKEATHN